MLFVDLGHVHIYYWYEKVQGRVSDIPDTGRGLTGGKKCECFCSCSKNNLKKNLCKSLRLACIDVYMKPVIHNFPKLFSIMQMIFSFAIC